MNKAYKILFKFGLVLLVAVALVVPLSLSLASGGPSDGLAVRLSTDSLGGQANQSSVEVSSSADGRYVAFSSDATNLVGSDTNGSVDVFFKDTVTGAVTLASADAYGIQSNGFSYSPSISADGRYVAFNSSATNLASVDTYGKNQVYVKNMETGSLKLVSAAANSYAGNDYSINASISSDGRYVAFESAATNLISGDNNSSNDVFKKDTQTGAISLVTRSGVGAQADEGGYAPAISANGQYVAFVSPSHLVSGANGVTKQIYRKDTVNQFIAVASSRTGLILGDADSYDPSNPPSISPDGKQVAFVSAAANLVYGDTNGAPDVFVKDLQSDTTTRVSTSSSGQQSTGTASRPNISGGGRFVSFSSSAADLVYADNNGASDIFVKDMSSGKINLVSRGIAGSAANGDSINPSISADGHFVSFESAADNLVAGDSNGVRDVFQVPTSRSYYWTWYDQGAQGHMDWVLMANPTSATQDAYFDLYVSGTQKGLTPLSGSQCPAPRSSCVAGQVPPGQTAVASYQGLVGGPVETDSLNLDQAITSQRSLWGNSLEEVLGTEENRLSDHFYWTWYDQTPGFTNWVMVANPNPYTVFYRIKVAGQDLGAGRTGSIAPGSSVAPSFPGVQGGPVEVQAWSDRIDGSMAANVIASQRVLSGGGTAFNEVPGVPAKQLSDHYVWTWYDQQSAGAADWVMVANPSASAAVYYQVEVGKDGCSTAPANTACKRGTLNLSGFAGSEATPSFGGVINGPVTVQAWSDGYNGSVPAKIIASQRAIWGPSFEEVPGFPYASLSSQYNWTWYDQLSPGSTNWVMVANPSDAAAEVYYDIFIGSDPVPKQSDAGAGPGGGIPPGGKVMPTFSGLQSGPVVVKTWSDKAHTLPADSIASQRVVWKGYFNEVLGTVLG